MTAIEGFSKFTIFSSLNVQTIVSKIHTLGFSVGSVIISGNSAKSKCSYGISAQHVSFGRQRTTAQVKAVVPRAKFPRRSGRKKTLTYNFLAACQAQIITGGKRRAAPGRKNREQWTKYGRIANEEF